MIRGIVRLALGVVLVLAVLIIFISPAIDLPPTALRSLKMANLLFFAIALGGKVLVTGLAGVVRYPAFDVAPYPGPAIVEDRVNLNCTRLC